jgi:outer membrane lipoprotein SlyB
MQPLRIFPALLLVLLLAACTQKDSSQASSADSNSPRATISMNDGTTVTGTVTSSTPSQITLNMDSGGTRTILTKDVKAIQYGDVAPANQTTANQPEPAPAPQPRYHPDESAIQTKTFEIAAGTQISVRNNEAIDSGNAAEGHTYAAEVTTDVRDANGAAVIPRGANAELVIKSVSSGGRIKGAADLVLALRSVSIGGKQYAVDTTDIRKEGSKGIGANKRTGEFVGGGAALGGIIGAIAGGGKGAIIGGATGAGAGGVTQVLTKGKSIKIPAETLMTFRLEEPVRVIERR